MKLANIEIGKLFVSKTNMRYSLKSPDVSDILPTVKARGIIVPLIVRPGDDEDSPACSALWRGPALSCRAAGECRASAGGQRPSRSCPVPSWNRATMPCARSLAH
jgi:ParB family chromosome partitioning protein